MAKLFHIPIFCVTPTVIVGTSGAEAVTSWRERVESLDSEHRHMLEGGTLSNFFLRGSLTSGHPVFVGGFYGALIGLAMLLPFLYNGYVVENSHISDVARDWSFQALILISMSSFLGGFSLLTSMAIRRPPTRLENRRKFIFPLPFLGVIAISIEMIVANTPNYLGWFAWALLILPGPLWVHLSYAPRWRILDRLDRDVDPFGGMGVTIYDVESRVTEDSDSELEEVVDIV
tara:strand:+ start:2888 stop:3580 length:693 start_codon:yes stop_codon:yes gene_type:complete